MQTDEEDKTKTAFTTGRALYQFNVMTMGLVNAPPTFQHLMQLVLQGLSWKTCLVYLDDIIVYSDNFSDHLEQDAHQLFYPQVSGNVHVGCYERH